VGAFARSLDLGFPLLSDWPENRVTQAYGTFVEGRNVSRRVTYVVNREGIIRAEIVSDQEMSRHAEESLRVVRELEGVEE
jgi:alkyl hydroperoxide reductase subunit AhpC